MDINPKEESLMHFAITDETTLRHVMNLSGTEMAIMTKTFVVAPASITRNDLISSVRGRAFQKSGDDDWWIEVPSLDIRTYAENKDDLIVELAFALNGCGMSVDDWPPYALGSIRDAEERRKK